MLENKINTDLSLGSLQEPLPTDPSVTLTCSIDQLTSSLLCSARDDLWLYTAHTVIIGRITRIISDQPSPSLGKAELHRSLRQWNGVGGIKLSETSQTVTPTASQTPLALHDASSAAISLSNVTIAGVVIGSVVVAAAITAIVRFCHQRSKPEPGAAVEACLAPANDVDCPCGATTSHAQDHSVLDVMPQAPFGHSVAATSSVDAQDAAGTGLCHSTTATTAPPTVYQLIVEDAKAMSLVANQVARSSDGDPPVPEVLTIAVPHRELKQVPGRALAPT